MPPARSVNRVKVPLLTLPILATEEVLRSFDSTQLLEFSTTSQQAHSIVSIPAKKATPKIDIEIGADCIVKFYDGANDLDHKLVWCIGNPDMSGKSEAFGSKLFAGIARIEPKKVTKRQGIQEKLKYAYKTKDCGISLDYVLKLLQSIFPRMQVQDLVLNSLQQFNLQTGLASLHTVKNLHINCPILKDSAKFLMEKLTITDRYVNKTETKMGSGIQSKITCSQEVFSVNSAWIDPRKLSELNCAKTHLLVSRITGKQVENYLFDWKNTDKYDNVQILEVDMRSDAKRINFQRLGARAYDRQSRPPTVTIDGNRIDCSQFLDFEKKDKSIGSICVMGNKVVFLAWAELLKNGATF